MPGRRRGGISVLPSEPSDSSRLENDPVSVAPELAAVMEQVHDRFRVSEGEAYVWYDRLIEALASLDPGSFTDEQSHQFFSSAHFLQRVVDDMLDDSGSMEDGVESSINQDLPVDPDDVSLYEQVTDAPSAVQGFDDVDVASEIEFRDADDHPAVTADEVDTAFAEDSFTIKDPEGLQLFLRDLEHFLMLDFDVRQSQTTGKLGAEYLQGACERADEFIGEMRGHEHPLQNKDLVRRLELVRRHPSRLLAQVMMRRINQAFPDRPELQFSYGRTLEPRILEEIQSVKDSPDHFDPRVSMCWDMMSAAFLQRTQDFFAAQGREVGFLSALRQQDFEREVAWMLDRYGGIQPSFSGDFLRLVEFAFSRLRADAITGERHFFDHLSLGRTREAFSMEREALARIQQTTLKSDKCNLPNERAFVLAMQRFHQVPVPPPGVSRERRNKPPSPIVVFFDLNGFKAVNDHAAPTRIEEPLTGMSHLFHKYPLGDQVLYHAGEVMRAALRPGQELFHIHGDEYALILPGDTTPEAVLRILATTQENLHQLALRFNMRRDDDGSFMGLGIAAGVDRITVTGPYDHDELTAHVADLMADAKQDKSLPPPNNYRSFADKCSYVLGQGFPRPGRYDRNGQFLHDLHGKAE